LQREVDGCKERETMRESISITDMTFAVLPEDDFTGEAPIGKLNVSIKEIDYAPVINRSGYYLFLNLEDKLPDNNTLIVESDSRKYYHDQQISLLKADITNHSVVRVVLLPTSAYPFPSGTTLVRGIIVTEVMQGGNTIEKPVSGAKVEIKQRGLVCLTGDKGDFVFYFKDLRVEDILIEDQKKFIKMGMGTEFDLSVTCEGYKFFEESGHKAEAYTTTVVNATLEPEGA
jgi:hypothetical protein